MNIEGFEKGRMMSIADMRCPRCGKQATEYEENKWRCLICNTKFVYEPPIRPNNYTVEEHVHIVDEETHYFTCAVCNGTFPRSQTIMYRCNKCGATICATHAVFEQPNRPPVCIRCPPVTQKPKSRIAEAIKLDLKILSGAVLFLLLLVIASIAESLNQKPTKGVLFLVLSFCIVIVVISWAIFSLIKHYRISRQIENEDHE